MARINLTRQAQADAGKLSEENVTRVKNALRVLSEDPLKGEPLSGPYKGLSRYRVGDFRIVYEFDRKSGIILVVKIRLRREAYR
jgi:mRNA interferase RelE/StbE